jgi:DNA-binding transcriptional MocR family regulator
LLERPFELTLILDPEEGKETAMIEESAVSAKLYQKLAGEIAGMIAHGTYRPGDRIPSVRRLSRNHNVSITTVLEAYRWLENHGWIEARPQSGYFVRAPFPVAAEPEVSKPSPDPAQVSMGELMMLLLRDSQKPDLLPLGHALPNPNLLPLEKLNRSLALMGRKHPTRSHSYDAPPGCKELRVQVARRAMEAGCSLNPEEIVTTLGCQEAIILALRALCRPGDTVAVESPCYFGVLQAIEMLNLRALELPTHPREGVSLDALRYALDSQPIRACLFTPNFHNPLGCCMPDGKKEELARLLADREIPLIEDDIYGDLYFGERRPRVAKALDKKGLVLLCSSFSKTLAPGYRAGWIAPGRFQAEIERLKFVNTIASPTLTQLAVADFLENGGYDHHLRKIRRAYAYQVAMMAQAVVRHFPEGSKVTQPAGGSALWIEMPESCDSLALYEQAIKAGIAFAPGPLFSAKQGYRNFLRLNAIRWDDETEAGLRRLGALASAL